MDNRRSLQIGHRAIRFYPCLRQCRTIHQTGEMSTQKYQRLLCANTSRLFKVKEQRDRNRIKVENAAFDMVAWQFILVQNKSG